MKKIIARGIFSILPLAISIWLVYSIGMTLDMLGRKGLHLAGWEHPYYGSGFVLVVLLLLLAGGVFSIKPGRWFFQWLEKQLLRFPFIKTVYGAVKDIAALMADNRSKEHRQTVLVRQANGGYMVGFVTSDTLPEVLVQALPDDDEWVPVLYQLSYQMAGVTTLVRKSDLVYVDWNFEQAMRFMITAGISADGLPKMQPASGSVQSPTQNR